MEETFEGHELEAQFSDGAWYDIKMRAADPSRDRREISQMRKSGLKQVIFDDSRNRLPVGWVDGLGPPQIYPFRSIFRRTGQIHKVSLDDVNKISTESLSISFLRSLCKTQESGRPQSKSQVVDFCEGDFVLIEGPDEVCWVAQLMEPYRGKLSDEIDDVDDDGPMVSVRWFYKPGELPKHVLRSCGDVDWTHEVFVSLHRDKIDGRLIMGKCSCCFGWERPDANFEWMNDQLFSYRTWDPSKKRVSTFNCPLLADELRRQIELWIRNFPYPSACRSSDTARRTYFDLDGNVRSRSPEEAKMKLTTIGGDKSSRSGHEDGLDDKPIKEERQRKLPADQNRDRSYEREVEGKSPSGIQSSLQRTENPSGSNVTESASQEPRETKKKHNRPGSAELAALQEDIRNSKKIIVEEGTKRHCKLPNFFTFDEPAPKKPARPAEVNSNHSLRTKDHNNHRDQLHKEQSQRDQQPYPSEPSKTRTRSHASETAPESQQAVKTEPDDETESRANKKPKKDNKSDSSRSARSDSDEAKEVELPHAAGQSSEVEGQAENGGSEEVAKQPEDESEEVPAHHVIRIKLHRKEGDKQETHADDSLEETDGVIPAMARKEDEERRDDDEDVRMAEDGESQQILKDRKHKKDSKKKKSKKSKSKRRDREDEAPSRRVQSPKSMEDDFDMIGEHGEERRYAEDEQDVNDKGAVNLFILEGFKIACMKFFRENQHKSVAYFLHQSSSDVSTRISSSVGISHGFRSSSLHAQCARFLKNFSREKKVIAAIIVVEENDLHYPHLPDLHCSPQDTYGSGLVIQIETKGMRRVWHVCRHEKIVQDVKMRELSLDNAIMPSILF
ncbi:hypothetical protein GUITHDRAFT_101575 [Guillardia theta CCMP2712]|uniref:BAH domain-containing protein n=1 Tax=Guillardia theta (strain CCMP2712) TaxID=905079 RepID=L1JXS5_GUITC|nr:hypothetical protein GUITHDRAFT_101575 [Guillardia theta CCMP2712]EKX53139.1 hypothetical protein GUITHDRAFT_101575 [Guillardia theta CCMP2712]|eukprot:XP_005840119.1 hypothetical protein GUITHDRAFT_101575 [Guillardia theta CCMP2712]